jgi:hypothetical protein
LSDRGEFHESGEAVQKVLKVDKRASEHQTIKAVEKGELPVYRGPEE